jgi:hypothetical protein
VATDAYLAAIVSYRLIFDKNCPVTNVRDNLQTISLAVASAAVNYDRYKFYKICPWGLSYETFYGRNLRILVIS